MSDPGRAGMTGPLEPYAAGFAADLGRQGFVPRAAVAHVQLAAHVSGWLACEGLDAAALTTAVVERFLAARRDAGFTRHISARALAPLLDYLRGLGVVLPAPEPVHGPVEQLLERYRSHLTGERALSVGTARGYIDAVRPFVAGRLRGNELDLHTVTARDVNAFVLAACAGKTRGPAQLVVTGLRSLLRFLHVEGMIEAPLASVVPSVASRRLAGLPEALEPGQVRQLLGSCDRRTVVGRRDYAILVLLARLGLRAGEVAHLGLDDIDWRVGEIVVAGKGPKLERLPLPDDVGEAIAGYLRRGRPCTAQGRSVFVRVQAPHRGLTAGGVTQVVFAAGRRAGLGSVFAHRLRHSAATAMLRAGTPLGEVGQVLRHRRQLTTAIYAKVDREALRSIARPWPGGAA